MRGLRSLVLLALCVGPVHGQICNVQASAPTARANDATARLGDVLVVCTGGIATATGQTIPTANIQVTLNAPVASRVLSAGPPAWTEVLLILDEPAPNVQFPCEDVSGICSALGNGTGTGYYGGGVGTVNTPQNRNVFQGRLLNASTIVFLGVPLDPPANGTRTFRITNLKANLPGAVAPNGQVFAFVSIQNPPGGLQLNNTTATVGFVQNGFASSVRDAANNNASATGFSLPYAAVATPTRYATLRFSEGYPAAFRTRTSAAFTNQDSSPPPVNQNDPTVLYEAETGFFNSTYGTYGQRGNLGLAGLADSGTRLMATMTNIPVGVTVYADLYATTPGNGVARLVSVDAEGAGPFNATPGANNRVALTPVGGTARAVWEVLRSDPVLAESFNAGIYLTLSPVGGLPGPILVQTSLAPTATSVSLPRFGVGGLSQTLFSFAPALPLLQVNPTALAFSATAGGQVPAQQLSISGNGLGPVPFQVSATPTIPFNFLPQSGTTPTVGAANVNVTPSIGNLAPGTYSAIIQVSDGVIGGGGGVAGASIIVNVPVTLTIRAAPRLDSFSPSSVLAGSGAFALNVFGANFPAGAVVAWNGLDLTSSVINDGLMIAQVPAALVTNAGTVQVVVRTPDNAVSGRPFPVNAQPSLQVTPLRLNFSATAGALSVPPQLLNISGATGLPFDVTSTRTLSLSFQPPAGTAPGFTSVAPNIGGLPPGSYSETIFINSSQAATNPVLSVPLTLTIRPAPRLDTLAPNSSVAGGPGFSLNIVGVNFQPGSFVRWNDQLLPAVITSETSITAQVPATLLATPGTAQITVTTVDGVASGQLPFTIMGALRLESIAPTSVVAGGASFALTIAGSGFLPGATVQVDGLELIPSAISPNAITVTVPAASLARPGSLRVTVTNPGRLVTNSVLLSVTAPTSVTLTSLSPDRVVARNAPLTVSLTGTGFVSGASVQFGNQTLPATTLNSTSMTVELPASRLTEAGTVPVTVTNPLGQTSNVLQFAILPALTLTSLSRTNTTAGSAAFSLDLAGSGFANGALVRVGTTTLTPTLVTPTLVTVSVPAAVVAREGRLPVAVVNPGGIASSELIFVVSPPPSISGLNPASATAGGASFTLTVNGSNFSTGARVTWNGTPLTTRLVSAGQLTADVPASLLAQAGAATINVLDANGVATGGVVLNVSLPALPPVSIVGPAASEPNRDQTVTVTVAETYPVPLQGELELVFTADGTLPDDPAIQFSNGSRRLAFDVPANTPPRIPATVKIGTVAGVITLTPRFQAGGVNVTPVGVATQRITVARTAPAITSMECARPTPSTFVITADGYTNTRSATQASFDFQPAAGVSLGTGQLSIDASGLFNAWFVERAATGVGGVFRYNQTFNVQGASSSVGAVILRLSNAAGTSTPVTATCR